MVRMGNGTTMRVALMPGRKGYRVGLAQRFWAKVNRRSVWDCWEWRGMKAHGYGYIWDEDKMLRAHRVAYELHFGTEIPDDRIVMHLCDNRGCVNPEHLRLGTLVDNARDCVAKGRHGNQHRKLLSGAPPEGAG